MPRSTGSADCQEIPSLARMHAVGLPSVPDNQAPPRSTSAPPNSAVWTRPPKRSRPSRTTVSIPAVFKAFATVNPETPAPITITRSGTAPSSSDPQPGNAAVAAPIPSNRRKLRRFRGGGRPIKEPVIGYHRRHRRSRPTSEQPKLPPKQAALAIPSRLVGVPKQCRQTARAEVLGLTSITPQTAISFVQKPAHFDR